jgi:LacI family transcriptional regulator
MPTMKEVALAAEVSTATVSHVINGTRHVREEVRQRVFETMERLNYQPNAVARGLRTKRTQFLALVIPDITNPFFTDLARGFQDAADQQNYVVVVCNTDRALNRELRFLDMLRQQRVDGLVLNPAKVTTKDLKSQLKDQVAVVLIGSQIDDPNFDLVMVDNVQGGFDAVLHLIELGHRRIGLVVGERTTSSGLLRYQGYRRVLERYGLPHEDQLITEGSFTYEGGYECMHRLLALPEIPTAVFATSDVMALGAMAAIEEAGLTIPGDISLIGFDDIPEVARSRPRLTTIAQPRYQMGWESARVLINRIENGSSLPRQRIVLEHTLVVRESTAFPRS